MKPAIAPYRDNPAFAQFWCTIVQPRAHSAVVVHRCDNLFPLSLGSTQLKRTPLHFAAAEGRVEVVKALLETGATIDAKDQVRARPAGGRSALTQKQHARSSCLASPRCDACGAAAVGSGVASGARACCSVGEIETG